MNQKDYKNTIVAFHIGRRNNQPGYFTFLPSVTSLQQCFGEDESLITEDFEGNPLIDEEWTLQDGAGNVYLQGRDECEATLGTINRDYDYDTDIVCTLADITRREAIDALYRAYQWDDINEHDERYPAIKAFLEEHGCDTHLDDEEETDE